MQIYIDGKFYSEEDAKVSVFDHGLLYGDGVFEGIRTYAGRVFELDAHIDRLYASAQTIALEIPISRDELVEAMMETIRRNDVMDGYIRLVVTRGMGDLGLNPCKCPKATVFCIAGDITLYPAEVYEKGFKVKTLSTRRNDPQAINPAVKSLNYLNNIMGALELRGTGVNEGLFLTTSGYVCECTADNLFLIKGRKLMTPNTALGALRGITRGVVDETGRGHGHGGGRRVLHAPRRLQRRRGLPHRHGGGGRPRRGGRHAADRRGRARPGDQRHHRPLPRVRSEHRYAGEQIGRVVDPARPLVLYDTTLRDGMQREGLSVSVDEKVRIAVRIADLGVHVIEGGFPGSNPKDEEFFRRAAARAIWATQWSRSSA